MSEPILLARKQGRAGRLTLNRPKALHALNTKMVRLISDALLSWRRDPEVELIVVDHAAGTRGFCAGGDVRMLAESGARDGVDAGEFFAREYRLNTLIKEYPKPCVAIMDGIVMGGGVGISVHGAYRVATPNTVFAMPETGIGLFPDVGGGWFLPRLQGAAGMWLALTGERLRGQDVLAMGVATHFADDPAGLADKLCTDGVDTLTTLRTSADTSFSEKLPEINSCFGYPGVEEIITSLDEGTDWARGQAATLRTRSPLSLKIAFRQLREGGEMLDFRDNMRMEYRIGTRLVGTQNFIAGVRAALIDKDNLPVWVPKSLEAIPDSMVDTYFAPLEARDLTFFGD